MLRFDLSKRRLWAILTATVMVAALVAAVALVRLAGSEAVVERLSASSELARIDDLAAAAETRVSVASLRANLVDPPTATRNGPHARRLSQALAGTLEREGTRAEAWGRMREHFAAFRNDLQLGDGAAEAHVAELEAELRTYTP